MNRLLRACSGLAALILPTLLFALPLGCAAEMNAVAALPADVAAFKERRELCDHFRGEDAYDAERGRFLAERMSKFCKGTDRELAALKSKYRDNDVVLRALADYEEDIEPGN